jgi:hypothetical protein
VTNALQADMIWRRRSNIELTLIRLHHRVADLVRQTGLGQFERHALALAKVAFRVARGFGSCTVIARFATMEDGEHGGFKVVGGDVRRSHRTDY